MAPEKLKYRNKIVLVIMPILKSFRAAHSREKTDYILRNIGVIILVKSSHGMCKQLMAQYKMYMYM